MALPVGGSHQSKGSDDGPSNVIQFELRAAEVEVLLKSLNRYPMKVDYTAVKCAGDIIEALGRTEDIKFSPDGRRLAVVCFSKNKVALFEVRIVVSHIKTIIINDAFEILSSHLKRPHGVDFIDDTKIIVANREGDLTIFELPFGGGGRGYELSPLNVIRAGEVLKTPGSVSITKNDKGHCEALVCNNFSDHVTKHQINARDGSSTVSEILLKKWISVPDGIDANEDWIAISNHNCHNVLMYEKNGSLGELSDPSGVLRCARYPHGLRFTSDGCFILVADGGAPYVHIYRKDISGWRGVRNPLKSCRVLKDSVFLRGHTDPFEGGPKGIDIDNSMRIFVTTCEFQPVAFFDLETILENISGNISGRESCLVGLQGLGDTTDADQKAFEVSYELDNSSHLSEDVLKHELGRLRNSRSWRLTAPYRWLGSLLGPGGNR